MPYLIVFIGGGFGSLLRHGVNVLGARWLGTSFPYHTLTVNITGSFVMGWSLVTSPSEATRPSIGGCS